MTVTNVGKLTQVCHPYRISPGQSIDVPMEFMDQYSGIAGLKFDMSNLRDQLADHDEQGRLTFDFWMPCSMVDGYSRHALAIWKGMHQVGAVPWLREIEGWVPAEYLDSATNQARMDSRRRPPAKIGLAMSLPYDPHIHDHDSVHKLVITQFETDHIPYKHIEHVNRCHHLIVTSSFQPRIWKDSGCKIPISVMTPGIDTDTFTYLERPARRLFRVLMLGALTGRKNPLGAIRIFTDASMNDPDWRLTIKSRKADGIYELQKLVAHDPRIQVIVGDDHPDAVVNWYHSHDCLLWPSKGEGCGLPPLEAMATGMELVCSDSSGMRDYLSDEWSYPIRIEGLERADIPGGFSHKYTSEFGDVGSWWLPDQKHAIKQLRKCWENWLDGKGKGERAAAYVREHHTLAHQARSVLKVVERYAAA